MTLCKQLSLAAALAVMACMGAAPLAATAQDMPAATAPAAPGDPGATPMTDQAVFEAFHGKEGIQRIADATIDRSVADPRIAEVFKGIDIAKLKTHLAQQLCYVLGGGCAYTGRDMATSHKDLGVNMAEMNALVENLQWAMDKEGVPFRAQNKLLAKLAPMKKDVVTR